MDTTAARLLNQIHGKMGTMRRVAERKTERPDSKAKQQNHSTQDSRVVPHRGTNWAALRLTAQIGRDAVLSKSYGRGYKAEYGHGSYAGL